MRTPAPTSKLIAFTPAGALLTAVVAGALAGGSDDSTATSTNVSEQLGAGGLLLLIVAVLGFADPKRFRAGLSSCPTAPEAGRRPCR